MRIQYIINKFDRFIKVLKKWFGYYKVLQKVYDFDFSGILEVEQYQLQRTIKSIEYYQSSVNAWHDIRWMKIADQLLDIILNKVKWWDITNSDEFDDHLRDNGDGTSTLVDWDAAYEIKPYINMRNAGRFGFETNTTNLHIMIALREEKVWGLYHKIRERYMRSWWD